MKAAAALCLLGAAALWAWALLPPPPAEAPLDPRFVGTYRIVRFEPPPDQKGMPNPYPQGQTHKLVLKPDGTFLMAIYVPGKIEMNRSEGRAYVDAANRFVLEVVSRNRMRETPAKDAFRFAFLREKEGETLHLVHEERKFHLFLLRMES